MFNILNLTFSELQSFMQETLQEPSFRATQLWRWLWQKIVLDFELMSNVSKETKLKLSHYVYIALPEIVKKQVSSDGTVKYLLKLEDKALIETVLIPGARGRITQCLSSQVGCAMACTFCSTGKMGFERNLTMAEILGQVLVARADINDFKPEKPIIRNLVFMGMGEPLLNLKEVLRSLETLNNPLGLRFSPRRITVSTCGIEKGLKELGESGLAFLAVSLHAVNQALREKIMPKAAKWHLEDMMSYLMSYPLKASERLTFEYLLLGGVNDSIQDAKALAKLMARLKGKLNIIVYNPIEGSNYKAPDEESILAFEKYLWSKNITAVLRQSKGQDIKAACGQLKAELMS